VPLYINNEGSVQHLDNRWWVWDIFFQVLCLI